MTLNEAFRHFAAKVAKYVGSSWAFLAAFIIVLIWAFLGVVAVGFTDTWLLFIDSLCTIITFLVVFLIQNTQNRHIKVMQLKLDALIKAERAARNDMIDMEELTDQELDMLQEDFHQLRKEFVDRKTSLIKKRLAERREAAKK